MWIKLKFRLARYLLGINTQTIAYPTLAEIDTFIRIVDDVRKLNTSWTFDDALFITCANCVDPIVVRTGTWLAIYGFAVFQQAVKDGECATLH